MKAIIYEKYGSPDNLKLTEVTKPIPKDNEVLIKIYASSINSVDLRFLKADPFFVRLMGAGFIKPKNPILGFDLSGRIESVGKNVKTFKPGDEVYGEISNSGSGGFSEYKCVSEDTTISLKPKNLSFEQAASVPVAAITAIQGLLDFGHIKAGQKVLINGASGGVGSFAILIAKAYGAEVTGVCSTNNLDLAASLGADHVIDYTKEDFSKNRQRYDLIFDVAANCSIEDYKRSLTESGVCVIVGFSSTLHMIKTALHGAIASKKGKIKIGHMGSAKSSKKVLDDLRELIETHNMFPAIDRIYPLDETAEAMRYFEEGHARAKVVISIRPENQKS